jgi:very-short-patch-repair endonuclease
MQTVPVATLVAAVAKRQHGAVTRAQLVELGLRQRQIERWVQSGRLERLLPGVFRIAGTPTTREQSVAAAVLWAGPDARASHRSAGQLWGWDGVSAARPEITVPLARIKKSTAVVVHQTRTELADRRTRRGIPITTPERTLIDLAGTLDVAQLEIAFESARRERQVTTASVGRALARVGTQGRSGADELTDLLATLAAEPPCESALEVMAARMLRASDLPTPRRHVGVATFEATYRLDFAWPDRLVALECDGRKWHEIESAFERDRHRWSAITAATGYRIVWATWRRVSERPAQVIAHLRELLSTSECA